ncbi:MAG: hypothetical protein LBB48_04295 [Treponema sp.]|nr:hypothetical protein [Treponema sp.]
MKSSDANAHSARPFARRAPRAAAALPERGEYPPYGARLLYAGPSVAGISYHWRKGCAAPCAGECAALPDKGKRV